MVLVIDNYDSFTYNIVQALQAIYKGEVKVVRSKETTLEELNNIKFDYLVISPGPGEPCSAGISIEAIKYYAGKIPILGVCLGMQAIGVAFGGKIIGAKHICHGKVEDIELDGKGLFRTIGRVGTFTRYHSLVIDEATLPSVLEVTARASDGDIMGVRHKIFAIEGVQFHPESIASKQCNEIFNAFLNYRKEPLNVPDILNTLIEKKDLSKMQAYNFMEDLTSGILDERQTAAILVAIAAKEPAPQELSGAAQALCQKKTLLPIENTGLAEIVGTGGDGKGSFNISSLSAIVCASCNQDMAKHGNKAVSSKSGAADFYSALGIKIDTAPEKTADLIRKTHFGFLMAPIYHSAMRFAAPVRKALGIKTIMNVLGPLSNPAGAEYQVLGVYSPVLLESVARAAKDLGAKRVLVITSKDGYDEISPCAENYAMQIDEDGKEYKYLIKPTDFGIVNATEEEMLGGQADFNAQLALDILQGKGRKTLRYAIGLNAGAVLYIAKKTRTLKDGYSMALNAIDSGLALKKLEEIKVLSNEQ